MNGQPPTVLQIDHSTVRKVAVSDAPYILFLHPSRPSTPRIRELTLKFLGSAAGLIRDSSLLLGWIRWAWTRSRGITKCQVARPLVVACVIVCNELFTDRHRCPDVLCIVVVLVGYVVNWNCMSVDFKVLMLDGLVWTERMTRLICASFGITRLIGVPFGITRLIRASFEITRLMCAFYGTTRLFM
ncbi:hypothetical protein E6C27_scaffold3921G00150 [Cucumis melo var. makuwa]|uniref:Ty3-gypsy retrotransposon protein n=1 Tax=Cucumis melo var. makuwa TaxID=1194695 RepID=A0A5A7T3I1_CUCMM|nr:hypothetical protein E6C27_scaffold3921G00150 [Cucumis melo var. makuwa]